MLEEILLTQVSKESNESNDESLVSKLKAETKTDEDYRRNQKTEDKTKQDHFMN